MLPLPAQESRALADRPAVPVWEAPAGRHCGIPEIPPEGPLRFCPREPAMSELVGLFNLLVPFFGLIGLGFFCGKVVRQHEAGLAWMQFFLIYVALPCLFFRLIADKPLDQLT